MFWIVANWVVKINWIVKNNKSQNFKFTPDSVLDRRQTWQRLSTKSLWCVKSNSLSLALLELFVFLDCWGISFALLELFVFLDSRGISFALLELFAFFDFNAKIIINVRHPMITAIDMPSVEFWSTLTEWDYR